MKLSIVSGLDESKSGQEKINAKFESLCEFLKTLKYDGIELSMLEPERINAKEINEIRISYGMEISALGTGSTFIRLGYSFGHEDEPIRSNAVKRIDKYIDFAQQTNSKVIIGLIRGRFDFKNNPKREKQNIIACLKQSCQIAENKDVELVFEPINRFEIDSYNTLSDSIKLLEEIGSDKLKLLVDTFHTHLEEDPGFIWDDLKNIAQKQLVGHIHLADCTRRAPGTGHFDFREFLSIFKEAGYDGFASLETIMKPSFEDVAQQGSEYYHAILNE